MANPDQTSRDPFGRYVRTPESAARDAEAAELRAQGWTYQRIGEHLGIHRTSVKDAIQRALRDIVQGPAEKLLAIHLARLEHLYEEATEILEAEHVVVSHGKVITLPDENGDEKPLKDPAPKLAAIREARATLTAFWDLTGMKKPAKVEHSGGVKYEVVGVDSADLT